MKNAATILSVLMFLLAATFQAGAQQRTVTIHADKRPLSEVMETIQKETGYHFFYSSGTLDESAKVSIHADGEDIQKVVDRLFKPLSISCKINAGSIILTKDKPQQGRQDGPRQSAQVFTGTIVDASGAPVIGAAIMNLMRKSEVAVTGLDGKFSLPQSEGGEYEVVCLGFKTLRIPASKAIAGSVFTLQDDLQSLEEAVVVGYGTQMRGKLTTSVSTLKGEEALTTTHTSLAQRVQGKIPGLQIRQTSGAPGSYASSINVRGFGTPLVIIDGTAVSSTTEFQKLDPEDIESISVLKDGSAAIYGMNASNGVILVTTKRGEAGKMRLSYNGSVTLSHPSEMPTMMNAYQYASILNDQAANGGQPLPYTAEQLENYRTGAPGYESVDWYSTMMKDFTVNQYHNLSASGGNDIIKFYASLGYNNEPGILRLNTINYEKYSFRANTSAKVSRNISAEVDFSGIIEHNDGPSTPLTNLMRGAIGEAPIHQPYANGNPDYYAYVYDGQVINPLAASDTDYSGYVKHRIRSYKAKGSLIWNCPWVKNLQLKGVAAYDNYTTVSKNMGLSYNLYNYDSENDIYTHTWNSGTSELNEAWINNYALRFQAQLSWHDTFAEHHHAGATLVWEQGSSFNKNAGLSRKYSFYTMDIIQYGDTDGQATGGSESETMFKSLLGRLTYDYKGKYMFEFAARYDGSYRYHPSHRWAFFPVYSVGWRASEEPFFHNALPFVSNCKLRFSYGELGQDAGNAFQYIGGFSLGEGGFVFSDTGGWTFGSKAPGVTNPNLTWYKSRMFNFGLDLGFLDNALSLTAEYYLRNRRGLLATRTNTLPNTFGAELPQENLDIDRVQGLELSTTFDKKITSDWRLTASANVNFARSMWVYREHAPYTSSYNRYRNGSEGRASDIVWMYQYAGQFQSEEEIQEWAVQDGQYGNAGELPGDFKYVDVNEDGIINEYDMTPQTTNGTPKIYYGASLASRWRNFDLSLHFQGAALYTVRYTYYYAQPLWGDANTPAYFFDRWHLADNSDPGSGWVSGTWPAIRDRSNNGGAMYNVSDRWRRDASFVRLKSVELGYTLPKQLVSRTGLSNARVSLNGYNLLTICDPFVKAFDPERSEGSDSAGWVYPLNRSYTINLNLTF